MLRRASGTCHHDRFEHGEHDWGQQSCETELLIVWVRGQVLKLGALLGHASAIPVTGFCLESEIASLDSVESHCRCTDRVLDRSGGAGTADGWNVKDPKIELDQER